MRTLRGRRRLRLGGGRLVAVAAEGRLDVAVVAGAGGRRRLGLGLRLGLRGEGDRLELEAGAVERADERVEHADLRRQLRPLGREPRAPLLGLLLEAAPLLGGVLLELVLPGLELGVDAPVGLRELLGEPRLGREDRLVLRADRLVLVRDRLHDAVSDRLHHDGLQALRGQHLEGRAVERRRVHAEDEAVVVALAEAERPTDHQDEPLERSGHVLEHLGLVLVVAAAVLAGLHEPDLDLVDAGRELGLGEDAADEAVDVGGVPLDRHLERAHLLEPLVHHPLDAGLVVPLEHRASRDRGVHHELPVVSDGRGQVDGPLGLVSLHGEELGEHAAEEVDVLGEHRGRGGLSDHAPGARALSGDADAVLALHLRIPRACVVVFDQQRVNALASPVKFDVFSWRHPQSLKRIRLSNGFHLVDSTDIGGNSLNTGQNTTPYFQSAKKNILPKKPNLSIAVFLEFLSQFYQFVDEFNC